MAAEDETTAVGRRGGSGRGRKQPIGKKDPNNHSAGNKKNSDIVKTIYSSDENSSEVGFEVDYYTIYIINCIPIQEDWSKHKVTQPAKKRKKAINDSD